MPASSVHDLLGLWAAYAMFTRVTSYLTLDRPENWSTLSPFMNPPNLYGLVPVFILSAEISSLFRSVKYLHIFTTEEYRANKKADKRNALHILVVKL